MDPNMSLDQIIKVHNIRDPNKPNTRETRYRPYRNMSENWRSTQMADSSGFRNRTGRNSGYDRLHMSSRERSTASSMSSTWDLPHTMNNPMMSRQSDSLRPKAYVDLDNMQEYEPEPLIESTVSPPRSPVHRPRSLDTYGAMIRNGGFAGLPTGYKLLVGNLHRKVTTSDIKELFGMHGTLLYAEVLHPGTAVVVYKHRAHAQRAYEKYHDRNFDGQPMYLTLSSDICTVDLDIVHQVLFGSKSDKETKQKKLQ